MRGGGGSSPFRDNGAINTGQNQPSLPNAGEVRSVERNFSQSLRELESMRGKLGGNEQDQAEIKKLLQEMAALDPNKFKGNPALVDQMRAQLLPVLEQLELKLRRDLEGKEGANEAKSATPDRVPSGYADQVAEYFRKLSKGSVAPKKN
jgi:hypothetical protein